MVLLVTAGSALAIIGRLRRALLGLALLDIPLQWDIYFGYRDDVDQMAGLAGFGVSLTTLALAGLYALWAAQLLVEPENALASVSARSPRRWPSSRSSSRRSSSPGIVRWRDSS